MEQLKKCSKCKIDKPLEAFHKQKTGMFGRKGACKTCRKVEYSINADKYREYSLTYKRVHKEERDEYQKNYREVNRERLRQDYKKWYKKCDKTRYRDRDRKRRALLRAAYVEHVHSAKVFKRDGWICQLCLGPVDPNLKAPDPKSKSLDHIVPLSKGGEHSYANTQLAHYGCNSAKRDRI